ncbi:hypothetical protein H9Q72_010223 [Fusarium xylarioides]|uniref:Cytochrome P450 monooxygenase n=1 Tax=Fusarium xylarioides TaxID=221167 RepID=A0A9P7HLF7_9HYPO|nr:hypothetical protein H9Q72_010223 [Fusarium xylarioides]
MMDDSNCEAGLAGLALAIIVSLSARYILWFSDMSKIPLINPPSWYDPMNLLGRVKFALNAKNWVEQGLQNNKPFRLLTEFGELTMIPAKYAPELRVDPRLDSSAVIDLISQSHLPGFEGFRLGTPDGHNTREIVTKHLSSFPDEVTAALSAECDSALRDILTDSREWHEVQLKERVMMLIARMSARIFLGDEGARNEAWLKITREYTTNGYIASAILRLWPKPLRPLVNRILPKCRQLRAQVMEARKIVNEIIDRHRKAKADALRQGFPVPVFNDAVEWWEQDTKDESDEYDPVIGQLVLSQSSIHTTTDFLTQVILDIAANPEVKGPLLEETKQAKSTYGWSKSALYSMRLTESVMKESQRMKPIARCTMNRMVLDDMNLSDGTLLKKGTLLGVSVDRMWDGSVYENPQKWDGWRFYRKYQQSPEARDVPIVNTGPNYLAWGHGRLACAGRFFVTQEAKVALAHLLLKYDWEIVSSPSDTNISEFGLVLASNPKARIKIRTRVE